MSVRKQVLRVVLAVSLLLAMVVAVAPASAVVKSKSTAKKPKIVRKAPRKAAKPLLKQPDKILGMPNMPPMKHMSLAERKAAAKRAAKRRALAGGVIASNPLARAANPLSTFGAGALLVNGIVPTVLTTLTPDATPDYFGTTPNWANSPLASYDASGNVVPGTGIRKFVDSLPLLGPAGANNLGNYVPLAVPDTTTYPGADYYVIALVEYELKLHSDLQPTKLRGYVQLDSSGTTTITPPSYLGPTIVAQKDRPVRVKFINKLPTGQGGDLFLPTDTTAMGAGEGPLGAAGGNYTQNRATIHLHGGDTPWISDGTPHQWITPAGENTKYPQGVSVKNVPDMPDPGPGAETFYYSNRQSARLMFYHDHSYGITRLNVYAGEAGAYLVEDPAEQELIKGNTGTPLAQRAVKADVAAGTLPKDQIPLVIQDRTFVPSIPQLAWQDPTWDQSKWGTPGDLWFPHVYMPNQNPYDDTGANAMGRWDYGPWFWPPYTGLVNGPKPNPYFGQPGEPPMIPGTPTPSLVPEAFMDTPLVNGTPYPYVKVEPKAYRFRILNACNDRFLNLQLYYAASNTPDSVDGQGNPTLQTASGEVTMTPAIAHPSDPKWPATWPTDGRAGGVPDYYSAGPDWIQYANEAGFLPAPAVIPAQPINYNYNRRDIVVLNVSNHSLFLGSAERADVVVDFSSVAPGSKIILYNDAPAPVPAFDPRIDYYTGDPDQTDVGGAPTTPAGYGPNTRTIMQFQVEGTPAAPFDVAALQAALPKAYAAEQPAPIVPNPVYNAAFGTTTTAGNYVRIQDTTITFKPSVGATVTMSLQPKAIQELFETDYGRMNATLGVELPNTNVRNQTTIPYGYIDPTTESPKISDPAAQIGTLRDGTQIWKITHNGVDTHTLHWHMFNVQVLNRVGWDGAIRPPEANEVGWKETVRANPLEDIIVALRPIPPDVPFKLPDSVRPLDVTRPIGSTAGFTNVDPNTGNAITVTNQLTNYGWEYVWHCHLLGHEENDFMRPMAVQVAPAAPSNLVAAAASQAGVGPYATVQWKKNDTWPAATMFRIERSDNASFSAGVVAFNALPAATSFTDYSVAPNANYWYRVRSENQYAYSAWPTPPATVHTPAVVLNAPTNLKAGTITRSTINITWTNPTAGPAVQNLQVQVAAGPNGPWVTRANLGRTATAYSINRLTAATTYWIRVVAVNATGSTPSSAISATTLP